MFRFAAFPLIGLALAAGCEGSKYLVGAVPPPPPPLPVFVTVGPDDATIVLGGTLQYQAVSTSTVAGWEWSVSNPVNGSISTDGRFTALQPGTFQVRACASNAPSICGAVGATVIGPTDAGMVTVTLTPAADTISVLQSVQFTVSGTGFVTPGWSWLAFDTGVATIDGNGLLTARRGGVTVVAACATSRPHYCASSEIHVR